jgi:NAD(P)-dependent dehydrogenase (short-subunit alcohol dehydrogenase family)
MVCSDGGRVCALVTSLLGAYTPFYSSYAGTKAPVEHFTRAASKEFGERGISVTAIGPGPMNMPFFNRPRVPMRRRITRLLRRCRLSPTPADRHRRYGAVDPLPGHRWLVDDRADHLGQWWVHHQVTQPRMAWLRTTCRVEPCSTAVA